MKHLAAAAVVLLIGLGPVAISRAAPAWGSNCLACHGQISSGTLQVIDADGTADPDESATGAPDRGVLKYFQGYRGQTKALRAEVSGLNTNDRYAVEIKRLGFPGVKQAGRLTYQGDCDWAEWTNPGSHYTDPPVGYRWGAGPTTFAFDIAVGETAPYDYYDLILAAAGKRADGTLFYAEEHFYLHVSLYIAPGDLDEDGDVDLLDFAGFLACLAGPQVTTPPGGCSAATFTACDFDHDGDVDLADFGAFTSDFTGPAAP